ncbi:MAG: DVUA0089 family protein [Geminicoccaceae bacterium]
MPNTLIKSALGLALGFLLTNPAVAVPLTPPTNANGTFVFDNDVEQFDFSIGVASIVTIESISYAGGAFASNPAIIAPAGGFDPILSLFDSTGAFIAAADDGSSTFDPVTGSAFDSFLQPTLDAGTYTVVITQFDNFFLGGVGDDISTGFEQDGPPDNFTGFFGCGNGEFCDIGGNNRTNFFAVNVIAEAQAVPEPSALAMIGFGLLGVGLAYRRRQRD